MESKNKARSTGSKEAAGTPSYLSEEPQEPAVVNIKTLLDAGAHYGHQAEKWRPKMLPYIYGERNGIHIINLDVTLKLWERSRKFVVDRLSMGGSILFVGTKLAARDIVTKEAQRCGAFSVTSKWLGGMLSNFQTIKNSIDRMRKLEEFLVQADNPDSKLNLSKKEKLQITRQLTKLNLSLGGIRTMKKAPDILFVVDIIKESIAVAEARRLHIPVVALVDTNTDPSRIDFPIPSNDDATRTIKLFSAAVADAVLEGRRIWDARSPEPAAGTDSSEEREDVLRVAKADRSEPGGLAASTA